jgi:hypothetical protein
MPVTADEVWERIRALEREFFRTHQGQLFTYRLDGDALCPSHSDLRIPRADFALVFPMLPLADPRKIAKFVTGYAYVAAVLHDRRVRRDDW